MQPVLAGGWPGKFPIEKMRRFGYLFFVLWQTHRENKKPKNKIADPNAPACSYMGVAFFVFFVFDQK